MSSFATRLNVSSIIVGQAEYVHLRYVYSLMDGRCNIHIGASLEKYSAFHMALEICKTCTVSHTAMHLLL